MYCWKRRGCKFRAICMSYTCLITDQSISRKCCYSISGQKPLSESEERRAPSGGLTRLQGLLCFHTLILSSVFQMDKKKSFVYSGYLEREMENISAHGPKKYTCQKKTQSATSTWFCFNKFTLSWEKQVLRKTTFVTFFCSWICLSNSKGFITLTAGAFPAERRGSMRIEGGQPLNSVFILLIIICWMTSLWPSF